MTAFPVNVSYSQIAVFNSELENPFTEWTSQHVAQGFSWRPGAVSFRTLIETGETTVEVLTADEMPALAGVTAIVVPFTCSEAGVLEIASIADGHTCKIPPGEYQLLFEAGDTANKNSWCRFTFIRNGSNVPQILRSEANMISSDCLLMHAEPA